MGDVVGALVLLGVVAVIEVAAWATAGPQRVGCDGEGCTRTVAEDEHCEHGLRLCNGCWNLGACGGCAAQREALDRWNGVQW